MHIFKAVQSQKTFLILFFIKFKKFAFTCHVVIKGNIFCKCCNYIIFIYVLRNFKSYENVLTPGGQPKADEIDACGALTP